jgi:hypothetical protein
MMNLSKIACRVAILFGGPGSSKPGLHPVRTYSIGEHDGATEFSDGSVYFWTHGPGGFIVQGGLGIWPSDLGADGMQKVAEILDGEDYGQIIPLNSWEDLPDEIARKGVDAFQSGGGAGAYNLKSYLKP